METVIAQGLVALISGMIMFAMGFAVNTLTGKSRAEVRGANAKAKVDETQGEKTAYELAQDVIKDLAKLREEYEKEKKERAEENKRRDERERMLEGRVETLEIEKAEWHKERETFIKKIAALEAKMRNSGGGLANK